jgi:ceramide glucosyltransferase
LIAGANEARGDVLCVLDDDTQVPHGGLELCLPFLDQPGVGLVFGLPYYVSFGDFGSRLVAMVVNSNGLLTYIPYTPYTALSEPLTIYGMFYALRREVCDAVGGFVGLERDVPDDFAVAHHVRLSGFQLAQTPLLHAISTPVRGPCHYFSLMQRWFLFPREPLLRHLSLRERALAVMPTLAPLGLFAALPARPMRGKSLYTTSYFAYSFVVVAHLNAAYLRHVAPWRYAWMVPPVQLLVPLQVLAALVTFNRMNWRGRVLRIERGGTFRYVERGAAVTPRNPR